MFLKPLILGAHLVVNRWSWMRHALGRVDSPNGSSHKNLSLEKSLAYIDRVFSDYLRFSGLTPRALEGKRVLEVGPGDNLAVALRFLSAGAAEVVCIDRFFSWRDPEKERRIYLAVRDALTASEKILFDNAVDLTAGIQFNTEKLRYIYGRGIEEACRTMAPACLDLIVSCAVLEEITNPDAMFSALDGLLKPGGMHIHKIDLRDYGMLSRFGYHPLEFCTIPDGLYRYASKFSPPNRLRIDYYRGKMEELGYESQVFITCVCGRKAEFGQFKTSLERGIDFSDQDLAEIEAIRSRLLPRFRNLSAEDLLATGLAVVAKKPFLSRWDTPLVLRSPLSVSLAK